MQKNEIYAIGILTPIASGANVRVDSVAGSPATPEIQFGSNDVSGSDAAIELIPSIPQSEVVAGIKMLSQEELRQIAVFGRPGGTLAAPVRETIVANTRYKIEIRHDGEENETGKKSPMIYSVLSNPVLSGDAAVDRENIFTILVNKINAHSTNHGQAFLLKSVPFTLGTGTALPTVGELFTQTTSGATARCAGVLISGGSIDGDDAAGIIFLYDVSGTWSASSLTLTGGTSGVVVTTAAALTLGEGLVFRDDPYYYPAKPGTRQGPSQVLATQGWQVYTVDVAYGEATKDTTGYLFGLAGLESRGIGTELLTHMPVFSPGKEVVYQGDAIYSRATGAFVAGKKYTQYVLTVRKQTGPSQSSHGGATPKDMYAVFFIDEVNSTYRDAWETAVQNAFSIVIA